MAVYCFKNWVLGFPSAVVDEIYTLHGNDLETVYQWTAFLGIILLTDISILW